MTRKFRKWHFLLLGGVLVLVSAFLWYWNWRWLGIPKPLQPEHFATIAAFFMGIFVLGVFIYRLDKKQVTIMLLYMVMVNMLAALVTLWIYRTFPAIFEILCPQDLSETSPDYLMDWKDFVLTPALYAMHAGLLSLWLDSLVIFLLRKPTDHPE
jgi:predicted permease